MALFLARVSKWQVDSWKRIGTTAGGTYYLLNTNRLDSMRDTDQRTSLYYFDNPFDHRDAGHYMVISDHTVAQVIVHMDTALAHNSITLAIYPDNDNTETPVDTEIPVGDFAYAVADQNGATRSWVTYTEAGWDIKTVLVNATLAALLAMV